MVNVFIVGYNKGEITAMTPKDDFKIWYAISFAWQFGFYIVIPIGIFLALGIFVDRYFHTAPLFLITGIVLSLVLTAYETYHLLLPLMEEEKPKQR